MSELNKEPCSRYWKEDRCKQNFGRTDSGEDRLETVRINEIIILKWIWNK